MLFTLILPPLEEQKPLELHPWMYPYTQDYPTHTFYANSHPEGDWPKRWLLRKKAKKKLNLKMSFFLFKKIPDMRSNSCLGRGWGPDASTTTFTRKS